MHDAGRDRLRHPRQPPGVRGRARRRSRHPTARRCGASATSSATAPSPTPASSWRSGTRRSAWPATTTSGVARRAAARAVLPRAPRSRRSGPRRRSAPETRALPGGLEPSYLDEAVGLYHASPRDPVWEYVLSPLQAELCLDVQRHRVCLIGHSHVALSFCRASPATPATGQTRGAGRGARARRGRVADQPGSVGQPRDGDPRAAWLELDLDALDRPPTGGPSTTSRAPRRRSAPPGCPIRWPSA